MTPAKTSAAELEQTLRMMDVADEIRRTRRRIEEHLEDSDREKIRAHLLDRYRAMGHAADPALLDAAIETVVAQQNRFRAAAPGFGTWLAGLYVRRRRLARRIGIPLAIFVVLAGIVGVAMVGGRALRSARAEREEARIERLADGAAGVLAGVREMAREPQAVSLAEGYEAELARAVAAGDLRAVRQARAKLDELAERLQQEYTVVILRGRERDNARHYLIVQAQSADGRVLALRIHNEESGVTEEVREWGERVQPEVYERVRRDHADNNVIDDNVLGTKRRGYLEPELRWPSAGKITRW